MNPKEFVISKIESIIGAFPMLRAIYEIDNFDNSHRVEFFPPHLHNANNKGLVEMEASFMFEFGNLFPYESLCFFAGDDFLQVEESIFEKKGTLYNNNIYSNYTLLYNYADLNIFEEFQSQIPNVFGCLNHVSTPIKISTNLLYYHVEDTSMIATSDTQYAMAA